ncbi:MAG: DNA/RNA nuclease SfsA [Clostridiaceae bacterium]|nr:DNA/RNA nuclease SfsA [Clostridiaceae bacterium]
MKYLNIVKAKFIERPNRFIAKCEYNGGIITAHVRNTGRCRELFIPGATVFLEKADNKKRKTGFSVIGVEKGKRLINIDSTASNKVLREAVKSGLELSGLNSVTLIRSEKQFMDSRFDLYIETDTKKALVEVKGVTLEENNIALFPDAPTERGIKHLKELAKAASKGYEAYIAFIVQMKDVLSFSPNVKTHPEFGYELKKASEAGVHVLCFDCHVGEDFISLGDPIPVNF